MHSTLAPWSVRVPAPLEEEPVSWPWLPKDRHFLAAAAEADVVAEAVSAGQEPELDLTEEAFQERPRRMQIDLETVGSEKSLVNG